MGMGLELSLTKFLSLCQTCTLIASQFFRFWSLPHACSSTTSSSLWPVWRTTMSRDQQLPRSCTYTIVRNFMVTPLIPSWWSSYQKLSKSTLVNPVYTSMPVYARKYNNSSFISVAWVVENPPLYPSTHLPSLHPSTHLPSTMSCIYSSVCPFIDPSVCLCRSAHPWNHSHICSEMSVVAWCLECLSPEIH